MERVAAIDIGTNTILLLIAEVEGEKIKPLLEKERIVRLGEGIQKNGKLLNEAMERGIQSLTQYLGDCKTFGVQKIFAVGTSALREAKNAKDFIERVKSELNLSIEVISGEEEAQLSFLAVEKNIHLPIHEPRLVVDVGGGSTEFIFGVGGQINYWRSLPMGSVRLTEEFLHSNPVQEEERLEMERRIRRLLDGLPPPQESFTMVAVGGTATTLASVAQGLKEFIPEKIHHFILKKEALRDQLLLYRSKTIEERKRIPGLLPARAEVILAGGTILYLAMEVLRCPSVLISCHGVRYGLLYRKLNLEQLILA